jgi:cyclopropane-fatty-acyl-phospholipid synthase
MGTSDKPKDGANMTVTVVTDPRTEVPTNKIREHYDVGNEFYALWLDRSQSYTCALYERGDTLEKAQERKMDWHVEQAGARGAKRVVDIGCGWGSITRRLVNVHGVQKVTAVNVSRAQVDFIASAGDPRIETRLESWSEHKPAEPYDAAIACGVCEHVVKRGIRDSERAAAYRLFFQTCHDMLKPGGRLAFQSITVGYAPLTSERTADSLALARIFPESMLPRTPELFEAADGLFEIDAFRNDREMYDRTCLEWLERLQANRARAVELVGEQMTSRFERYLEGSARLFREGVICLVRMGMRRAG